LLEIDEIMTHFFLRIHQIFECEVARTKKFRPCPNAHLLLELGAAGGRHRKIGELACRSSHAKIIVADLGVTRVYGIEKKDIDLRGCSKTKEAMAKMLSEESRNKKEKEADEAEPQGAVQYTRKPNDKQNERCRPSASTTQDGIEGQERGGAAKESGTKDGRSKERTKEKETAVGGEAKAEGKTCCKVQRRRIKKRRKHTENHGRSGKRPGMQEEKSSNNIEGMYLSLYCSSRLLSHFWPVRPRTMDT
jgi:hypothetical protein